MKKSFSGLTGEALAGSDQVISFARQASAAQQAVPRELLEQVLLVVA